MPEWQMLIPKCFSPEGLVFADTPERVASAWRLRTSAVEGQVSPGLVESAIEDWLHTQTSNTGQLYEQMARVRAFFGRDADAR